MRKENKLLIMVVSFVLLILALLCAQGASGQHYIEAPKPKPGLFLREPKPAVQHRLDRHIFITGISLLAAAKTADAITTRQVLDRGGWETNPIFGRHPSIARQVGINAGSFAVQSVAFYFTERNHHRWIRTAGRVWFGVLVVNHAKIAACNSGLNVNGPPVNCTPLIPYI